MRGLLCERDCASLTVFKPLATRGFCHLNTFYASQNAVGRSRKKFERNAEGATF